MPKKNLFYLDSEFTRYANELDYATNATPPARGTFQLIYFGAVDADGDELYFEIADRWTEAKCNEFTQEIVLPQLNPDVSTRISFKEAGLMLSTWLQALGPCQACVDHPVDWFWLQILLKHCWPQNLDSQYQRIDVSDEEFQTRFDAEFDIIRNPRHHALNDARALRIVHQSMQAQAQNRLAA